MRKHVRGWIIVCVLMILLCSSVLGDPQYNRERAKKNFDKINWHSYSPETFAKALEEQKPIYLVVSAPAWCYWCHVYESEDFLFHEELYPYINEHFIAIFVDSDKRPDLTKKYLEGGWPSTTIMTPNMERIEGFTGPRDPIGLRKYLESVVGFLQGKRFDHEVLELHYSERERFIPQVGHIQSVPGNYIRFVEERYDPVYGGIGLGDLPEWREGQQFPKPLTHVYLLEEYARSGNEKHFEIVSHTFENQFTRLSELKKRYHLYDPVEGGFHRYSTKRDWSVPHYEKMLGDQAKFLLMLDGLYRVRNDSDLRVAFDGTVDFVLGKMFDSEGGFYSSQDAHLESHFFEEDEQGRRKLAQPFVDETFRTNDNGLMVYSFLRLYESTRDERFLEASSTTLDFFDAHMVGEDGVLFYFDQDEEKGFLSGQSISNSYGLLMFVSGGRVLKNDGNELSEKYVEVSRRVADYSLSHLYDWKSGGFFERNSKDVSFYAPSERVDLSKPYGENAVFSYAMLELFLLTDDVRYLDAGLSTLGYLLEHASGTEETYFALKAGELVVAHDLISVFNERQSEIVSTRDEGIASFFVPALLEKQTQGGIDGAPQLGSELGDVGFFVLVIVSFLAGLLSFISPCTLPVLMGFATQSVHSRRGKMVFNTLFFVLGLAIVFSLFGMGATYLGNALRDFRGIVTRVAGGVIVLFGVMEFFGVGFSGYMMHVKKRTKGWVDSLVFGLLFGVGWSACIGPILASVLIMASTTGTIIKGTFLLFVYALGLGVPLVLVALWFDKSKMLFSILKGRGFTVRVFGREIMFHTTYVVTGLLLVVLGVLIFNDFLFSFNKYALSIPYVQNIIIGGEEFLKRLIV